MKFLHITKGGARCLEPAYFREQIQKLGELTIIDGGRSMSPEVIAGHAKQHDVYLAGWDSVELPISLVKDRGRLKYICGITGGMRPFVPLELVEAGIPLTNWGDAPAWEVAEGAMLLLLACLKSMHGRIVRMRDGGDYWKTPAEYGGSLVGMKVGVYGCGVIGRRFIDMIRPFETQIRIFDPYLDKLPEGCARASSLEELFKTSEAIVIHAGLTDETRKTVTKELLAMLPDRAVFINTARGGIVDQEALFAELEKGRLRAGLDVLEPDNLPADHPARKWENLILTGHAISHGPPFDPANPKLTRGQEACLDNLRRFIAGEPLKFAMDPVRYARST